MHEPAACGVCPAQQARLHSGALARVVRGKVLDTRASNSAAARIILAAALGEHWIR